MRILLIVSLLLLLVSVPALASGEDAKKAPAETGTAADSGAPATPAADDDEEKDTAGETPTPEVNTIEDLQCAASAASVLEPRRDAPATAQWRPAG